MGLHSRLPTSNEPETFDRTALMLRLGDEEARRYIKHLEARTDGGAGLLERAVPIVEAVVDAAQDEESKQMLQNWIRDAQKWFKEVEPR